MTKGKSHAFAQRKTSGSNLASVRSSQVYLKRNVETHKFKYSSNDESCFLLRNSPFLPVLEDQKSLLIFKDLYTCALNAILSFFPYDLHLVPPCTSSLVFFLLETSPWVINMLISPFPDFILSSKLAVVQSLSPLQLSNSMDCSMSGFLSPRVCSNSCPLSRWCYLTISSSATPFSFCIQSFPASGSFPMSWLFVSGGQSIGASALLLPMNIQGWFPLGLTGLISLQSRRLSRVFSNTTIQKHQFFDAHPSLVQLSHPYMTTGKTIACQQRDVSAFSYAGHSMAYGILASWPGTKYHTTCIARWILNHWTTREVPNISFYFDVLTLGILERLSLPPKT